MNDQNYPKTSPPIPLNRLTEFAQQAQWYHTIELYPGVKTSGVYDHSPYLKHYRFPENMSGLSVLDVGAGDGFFSFEFERRGASSILAIDNNAFDGSVTTDVSPSRRERYEEKYLTFRETNRKFLDVYKDLQAPPYHQLLAARALLNSRVEYRNLGVYELASLNAKYDFVFCGDLIEHLKNPLLALENLAAVTGRQCVISLSSVIKVKAPFLGPAITRLLRRTFHLPISDPVRALEYFGNDAGGSFFHFYPETFRQALLASGFSRVEMVSLFDLPNLKHGVDVPHAIYHCFITQ